MSDLYSDVYSVDKNFLKVQSLKVSLLMLDEFEIRFSEDLERNSLLKERFINYKKKISDEYRRMRGLFNPAAWRKSEKDIDKYFTSYINSVFSKSKPTNEDIYSSKAILMNYSSNKDKVIKKSSLSLEEKMEYISINSLVSNNLEFISPLLLLDINKSDKSLTNSMYESYIVSKIWDIIYQVSLNGKYNDYEINKNTIKLDITKILIKEFNIKAKDVYYSQPVKLFINEAIDFLATMVLERNKQKDALTSNRESKYTELKAKKKEIDSVKILNNYLASSLGRERFCVVNGVSYKRFDEAVNYLDRVDDEKRKAIEEKLKHDDEVLRENIKRILPFIKSENGNLFSEFSTIDMLSIIDVPLDALYRKIKSIETNAKNGLPCSKLLVFQRRYLNLAETTREILMSKINAINFTINNLQVTDDDKTDVINFMEQNGYQLCYVTYNQLLKAYMNNNRSFYGLDRKSVYKSLELRRTFNEIKNAAKKCD